MVADDCKEIERRALERQRAGHPLSILPVLLRPVDWEHTAINHLQILPDNRIPIVLWPDQDQALLNIATGIRHLVETMPLQRGKSTQVHAASPMQQTESAQKEVLIKNYIYLSDMKMMNMLEQQVGWKREDIAPFQKRYQALSTALHQLEKTQRIWHIQSEGSFKDGDYVTGICPMKWGTVKWDSNSVCFFFATLPSRILLMAGSAHHLLGNGQSCQQLSLGISGSDLPGILSALEFAAERSNVKWSRGIGTLSDYLFALAFVQGKFFAELRIRQLATAFPEQMLDFTALVHKTLPPPSAQERHSFFQSNTIIDV
jgi:hypothetical protein